jgi:hypothetical protein
MKGLLILLVCIVSTQAQSPIDLDAITKPIIDKFNEGVQNGLINLLEQIKNLIPVGKRGLDFQGKFEVLKQQVEQLKESLTDKVKAQLQKLNEKLQAKFPNLVLDFSTARRDIQDATQSFQDQLQQMFQNSLDHMKDIISQFASQSIDKIIGYVTKPAKRDVLQNFNDLLAQLGQALSDHASNIGQTLVDHGNNVIDTLKPHLDTLKEQLTQHGLNAAQSILDALANASGSLSG